ncbi:hypothetical protein AX15_003433 [Amanita polypyramis BW_CC]|nr:hypothetical protein AX15_003433 [Amanita polypyramis BW_CC]
MSTTPPGPSSQEGDQTRPRGRGKSRGGLGKYLRARGRRGYGRPAEFNKRLLLEGEAPPEDDEEAEQIVAENARKYSRRQLTSNADRYEEPEPELGSDGEPIVEPEVNLTTLLEKQKLSKDPFFSPEDDSDGDIDYDIAPWENSRTKIVPKKGRVQQIEWTEELETLQREKVAADAARDLKKRFRAKSEKLRTRSTAQQRRAGPSLVEAPPLPLPEGAPSEPKGTMKEMEDFLDDLLK